jgi:hypothetical protein
VIFRSRMTLPPPQLLLHSVFFQKLTSQSMGQGNSLHASVVI